MLVGLFPELTAPGGIQRGSRHMAAVLASEASRSGRSYRLYSLNDVEARAEGRVGDIEFTFAGFQRSKARFVRAALAARGERPSVVLAAHPNLAPLAWTIRVSTGARMIVVAWGIDVWDPLPVVRRMALRSADAVLAISAHTATAVVRTQGVHPSRVRLLPLALEPAFRERQPDGTHSCSAPSDRGAAIRAERDPAARVRALQGRRYDHRRVRQDRRGVPGRGLRGRGGR